MYYGCLYRNSVYSMFNKKLQPFVFAFFMALLMSCLMSFVITVFNIGLVNNLISQWLQAWSFAFVVAYPAVILVAPVVHKLTALAIKQE